ncbi:MAG: hypothetical protein KAR42_14940 [candidate division Zixibacteria bacterium]|nr:hypothetical protein [candidate division Zixibacteria bacterium]
MNSYTEKGKSFTAGEALVKYRRVKKSAANVVYADAGEDSIGVTMDNAASGASVNVKLFNDGGTFPTTAAGAIATNTAIYGAADGKISDTVSGEKVGTTNEASGADGDVIEIIAATPASFAAVASLIADPADPAAITGSDPAASSAITGAEPAACAAMTAVLTGVDTGTDMTAAQAATIVADFTAVKTAIDGNNVAIDANIVDIAALKTAVDANNTAIDANIVDIAALRTAILANNAAIESILDALQANGIVATA